MPQHTNIMASRLREITKMNPHMFFGSRSEEDSQYFLDEVYKILYDMGVTSFTRAMLEAYELQDVTQTWFTQWRDNKALKCGLVTSKILKKALVDRFFP